MNDTEVSLKFNNVIKNEAKLDEYIKKLEKVKALSQGINVGMLQEANKTIKQLDKNKKKVKDVNNETGSLAGIIKNLASNFKSIKATGILTLVTLLTRGLSKLVEIGVKNTKLSFDYLENLNLFAVAFKQVNKTVEESSRSAIKFTNTLSEMYGLDESWVVRTTGKFKQLANAMNLGVETGEKLSKLLTQMSLDLASLYNVDIDRASSVLQSSLAGQTKPIRGLAGGDITQATLQVTLDNLGIERTVSNLSFAEKRLLIIISLTQQLNKSIGDMGRTIESPANQMRILNEQWNRLNRQVGNVFLPLMETILPYLNAILMVLTEIISNIAILVGFTDSDAIGYAEAIGDEFFDMADGISSAGSSAKQLKQTLRGFDRLNNITTPASGGAGGGSGAGGMDPKILEAFNKAFDDYQNRLDKVEMKATRIRDKIMSILGFTKQIDEATGDVSFKYTGMNKWLKLVVNSLASAIPSLAQWKLTFSFIKGFFSFIKSLFKSSSEELDIFNNVSARTKDLLVPIKDSFEKLRNTINTVSYDGLALTKEEKQRIIDSIDDLTNTLKLSLSKYVDEQVRNLNYLYKEMGAISEEEYNKRLQELQDYQKQELEEINKQNEELKNKYQTVYDENGNIIMSSYAEYLDLLDKYENKSYDAFALGEEDKAKLQENIQKNSKDKTVKNYSELLTQYAKDRDEAIKKAEEKRDGVLKSAEELYGKESSKYKEIEKVANERYENEVTTAKENYDKVYKEFAKSQKEIADYIDKDDGGIVKKAQQLWNKVTSFFKGDLKLKVTYETNVGAVKTAIYKALGLEGFPKLSFKYYANGGLPPVGQMFVANEKGAELVGHLGGQTFVANQNQMMDLLDKKIGNAQSSKAPQIYNIYLDENHKLGTYTLEQLQGMAKTNGRPITIGG